MLHKLRINVTEAEAIGLKALTFLCSEESRLNRFLALTGLDEASLRRAASDPNALTGVLAYLLENETDLMIFAEEQAIDPRLPQMAHDALAQR
jgi:hypothetical protein